ncbi:MAG: 50S ribosomal protein L21 [Hyphomicrobiaceae bacterium]
MYAVIKTGGKQYRVAPEDILDIEKIDASVGDIVQLSEVLMLGGNGGVEVGKPTVAGASVAAEVVEQGRAAKVIIFKKRRRKNSRRKNGHRQHLTTVRITEILTGGQAPDKSKAGTGAPRASRGRGSSAGGGKAFALLDAPEGTADDLSLIGGVGEKINEKLNAMGIFHFWQVAAMAKADIEKVESDLGFKGRVEREEWIEQAKELMAGKPPRAKTDRDRA